VKVNPITVLLALVFASAAARADVYKCVGADGKTRYQATACAAGVVLPIDDYQPPLAPKPVNIPLTPLPRSHGPIVRSETQKNVFKSLHPCPSNGETYGPCPGYVIDHIKPLACGGADAPSNMQWQTVTAGKAKDAWERLGCQQTARLTHPIPIHRHKPRLPRVDELGAILLQMP
jgi:hypothetical protein